MTSDAAADIALGSPIVRAALEALYAAADLRGYDIRRHCLSIRAEGRTLTLRHSSLDIAVVVTL